ncbi:MAG: Mrp/NBP35 family ATP-binding protein [Erysipelotrichaceae bacterium]|nr:Mrp/NBP35 family ATP-binding protein [Erysipelotrichaceae bacterium]
MSECNHDCANCSQNCAERDPKSFLLQQNSRSNIKKIIAVVSGKGGVGKSLVTSLLASALRKNGNKVGIMDADITGPSIPQAFGLHEVLYSGEDQLIIPAETKEGIKVVSTNLLLEDPASPVVWRGPIIASMVNQFYTDVAWGDIDYLLVDLPPGTGDVPLTVFQSLPVDGVIIVTTPQDLVSLIVEKAMRMANMMSKNVLGIVENMSYVICPDCGKKISLFGSSKTDKLAKEYGLDVIARLPLDPQVTEMIDGGNAEDIDVSALSEAVETIKSL